MNAALGGILPTVNSTETAIHAARFWYDDDEDNEDENDDDDDDYDDGDKDYYHDDQNCGHHD